MSRTKVEPCVVARCTVITYESGRKAGLEEAAKILERVTVSAEYPCKGGCRVQPMAPHVHISVDVIDKIRKAAKEVTVGEGERSPAGATVREPAAGAQETTASPSPTSLQAARLFAARKVRDWYMANAAGEGWIAETDAELARIIGEEEKP